MQLSEFDYDLPENLIGQKAIEPRDSCRLMVLERVNLKITDHVFTDIVKLLDQNSVLVLNDTKVFPARLMGHKETGGRVEILLLRQITPDSFSAIGKGKLKNGLRLHFDKDFSGEVSSLFEGEFVIRFNLSGIDLVEKIDELGKTPLPPYIHTVVSENELRKQYQTIFAREKGSAAAPTAGLHFTDSLFDALEKKGVQIEKVTLHVGLGTFKPVTDEQIASKTLHKEKFLLSKETATRLNQAKKNGKKIIAVGTTTCRVLETLTDDSGTILPGEGETDIFIQPGYRFKFINGLITNFHLPKTSLLMLVTALVSFPNSPIKFINFKDSLVGKAYLEAIKKEYKFFSFGDAMLIL